MEKKEAIPNKKQWVRWRKWWQTTKKKEAFNWIILNFFICAKFCKYFYLCILCCHIIHCVSSYFFLPLSSTKKYTYIYFILDALNLYIFFCKRSVVATSFRNITNMFLSLNKCTPIIVCIRRLILLSIIIHRNKFLCNN